MTKEEKEAKEKTDCSDKKCAIHGGVKVRGSILEGRVISAKAPKTVTVERLIIQFVPKYERFKKIRSRVHAHNPPCIGAKEGEWVRIGESRKLSKTKAFVVLEKFSKV